MTLQQRIDNYHKVTGFPKSLFIGGDGRIVGTWVMGNNYTVKSTYYGGYPHGYLKRIKALFPDKLNVLHLCSGMVDLEIIQGDTVDINPERNPTYCVNAETCEGVPLDKYDLILIDFPYSTEDCEHYGTAMLSRNKVFKMLGQRLSAGCHVVCLDQVLPMYKKVELETQGYIGMVKSTNHRFRVITIFEKKDANSVIEQKQTTVNALRKLGKERIKELAKEVIGDSSQSIYCREMDKAKELWQQFFDLDKSITSAQAKDSAIIVCQTVLATGMLLGKREAFLCSCDPTQTESFWLTVIDNIKKLQ